MNKQIIVYEPDERTKMEVRTDGETVWLTQQQMADLFGVKKAAISKHIKNIYACGELEEAPTVSKMETVQIEGNRTISRTLAYYDLDMIISVEEHWGQTPEKSSPAVYYNFPQPTLDDAARARIAETAQGILDARAIYADKPLADIYGEDMYFYPEVMKAHEANDAAVLAAYGFSPEATECEIVSRLFDLYEKLTKEYP